jgi:hypothetical protein
MGNGSELNATPTLRLQHHDVGVVASPILHFMFLQAIVTTWHLGLKSLNEMESLLNKAGIAPRRHHDGTKL